MRLSRSGPGFDSRSGQVSWVRFSGVFPHPKNKCQEPLDPNGPQTSSSHHIHLHHIGLVSVDYECGCE
ncbi:hypothetical protein C0J52_27617 [Blattella germanica]|nr:hypothetical protein C0J52_27617 [Blattella germanica]